MSFRLKSSFSLLFYLLFYFTCIKSALNSEGNILCVRRIRFTLQASKGSLLCSVWTRSMRAEGERERNKNRNGVRCLVKDLICSPLVSCKREEPTRNITNTGSQQKHSASTVGGSSESLHSDEAPVSEATEAARSQRPSCHGDDDISLGPAVHTYFARPMVTGAMADARSRRPARGIPSRRPSKLSAR